MVCIGTSIIRFSFAQNRFIKANEILASKSPCYLWFFSSKVFDINLYIFIFIFYFFIVYSRVINTITKLRKYLFLLYSLKD